MTIRTRITLLAALLLAIFLPATAVADEGEVLSSTSEQDISVQAKDGVILNALLVRGKETTRPLVVLLHALGRDRDGLLPLADGLASAGFSALAVDLRGHGSSALTTDQMIFSFKTVKPSKLHLAVSDLELMLAQLARESGVDTSQVILAGVGQGALVAAEFAARKPSVKALVVIDPPQDYAGFRIERDLGYLGARPACFVCSAMESSRERALTLAAYGLGEREIYQMDRYDTHDRLLGHGSDAIGEIVTWLVSHFDQRTR